jgi:hypothetical protein
LSQRDHTVSGGQALPHPAEAAEVRVPHARLALARRRAAERDRTREEFEAALAHSRLILRVERALRQLLAPREVLLAAAMVEAGGSGRRGWAVSGRALYVGDFARLDVTRVPLERIAEVGMGVDGPPFRVTVDIAGEPPRRLDDSFGPSGLEVVERLVAQVHARDEPPA